MARSVKKGPYIDERLMEKMKDVKQGGPMIKTWSRSCVIAPEMVGFNFGVHNGKDFVSVKVNEDMVGHKLGEFSPTTRFSRHGGKMQKELEAAAEQKAAAAVTGEVKPGAAGAAAAKPAAKSAEKK